MAAPSAPYLTGSKKETLDAVIFGEPFHESLVHDAVRAEMNASRRGTASTLTRGEVSMTTAKAFRQKGTGRARAGALSTPNRYGGGVAFGPKPRHYTFKVNRKARRKALRAALSLHAARGTLSVVDPADFAEPSTKKAADGLKADLGTRVLVVLAPEGEESTAKSFRNLERVHVLHAGSVGVADILAARRLVLSPAAIETLVKTASAPSKAGDGA
jgi:large subunit ribosomal protein L4